MSRRFEIGIDPNSLSAAFVLLLHNSCPHCSKTFTHRSTLKQHTLVHEGSRPYKCHVCTKSFVQNSNYRIHLLTHKDKEDRIQKCDLCGKELLSRRGVQKHRLRCVKKTVETVNAIRKTTLTFKRGHYPCQKCPRIFTYHRRLLVHENTKHTVESEQDLEGAEPHVLEPHDSEFPGQETDKLKAVGDKRLHCPFCKRTFVCNRKLEDHRQKAHAGLDPENVNEAGDVACESETSSAASQHASSVGTVVRKHNIPDVGVGINMSEQSSEAKMCVPSDVTIVHIPVEFRCAEKPLSGPLVGQASSDVSSTDATKCGPLQQSNMIPARDKSSVTEGIVMGSQALSALQRLSARVGLDVPAQNKVTSQMGHVLLEARGSTRESARGSVHSEHLSALEQLSQKVGDDSEICQAVEATLDPSTQIPLRYPCLESGE